MHFNSDIGKMKVQSIEEKIHAMNPDVIVETFQVYADENNIVDLLTGSDYVIEASDNMHTKFLVNNTCIQLQIPFTIAGVVMFTGQIFWYKQVKPHVIDAYFKIPNPKRVRVVLPMIQNQ